MINKFFDIENNIISHTGKFLQAIQPTSKLSLDEAFIVFKKYCSTDDYFLFQKTISYLYLLGKIDFNIDSNSLEIINEN